MHGPLCAVGKALIVILRTKQYITLVQSLDVHHAYICNKCESS